MKGNPESQRPAVPESHKASRPENVMKIDVSYLKEMELLNEFILTHDSRADAVYRWIPGT
jgi:hypothetical protein